MPLLSVLSVIFVCCFKYEAPSFLDVRGTCVVCGPGLWLELSAQGSLLGH
jgi:hypothetical protein